MIMALGRWKSTAWMHYLIHTPLDFKGMASAMWAVQAPLATQAGPLRVGVCETQAEFSSDAMEVEAVEDIVERKLDIVPLIEEARPVGQLQSAELMPIGVEPIAQAERPEDLAVSGQPMPIGSVPIGSPVFSPAVPTVSAPVLVDSRPPVRPDVVPLSFFP